MALMPMPFTFELIILKYKIVQKKFFKFSFDAEGMIQQIWLKSWSCTKDVIVDLAHVAVLFVVKLLEVAAEMCV